MGTNNLGLVLGRKGQTSFLVWAVIFFILAIVAGLFGFGFISGVSYTIAKWLAVIFIILFIVFVIARIIKRA